MIAQDATTRAGRRRAPRRASAAADEITVLRGLWVRQCDYVAAHGDVGAVMDYVGSHFAMDISLERHIRVLDMLAPFVRGRVLEWGCQHALDSCVYRMRLGGAVELYGCDIVPPAAYRPFYEFSGIRYAQLRDPVRLDYDDGFFDVVTSNGVLEHVPDDAGSAREIVRVLRPGGTFVVTCLPNRYSYTEALQRRLGHTAHDRLYTIASARALLAAAGFEVAGTRRFFMLPTMLNGFSPRLRSAYQRAHRLIWAANDLLECAWPLNRLASNLMLVARKPTAT